MSQSPTYQKLREMVKAKRFLEKFGFSVELYCNCDQDNPTKDCLRCRMDAIKLARRKANEAETVEKEKQRHLANCENYLMTHGYRVTRPDGVEIPFTIATLEHRVRCGTINLHHAWAFLRQIGKKEKEAEDLLKHWSWPKKINVPMKDSDAH